MNYYDKKTLEVLRSIFDRIPPLTWHKMMNPMCGQCLVIRGKETIEKWRKDGNS